MTQVCRLAAGGRIDRSHIIPFTFDGRMLAGHRGDTLASALLANDVHFVARSFKYHRPRGIVGSGVEEPNALLTVERGGGRCDPNRLATLEPLEPALSLRSQNCWPTLRRDFGALSQWISPLLPAGFYYKTFLRPRWAWHRVYEPLIRRSAGLGSVSEGVDPDEYAQRFAYCDVLVVGGGPTGLAAAVSASAHGASVILCDDQTELGGSLLGAPHEQIDGTPAWDWLDRVRGDLTSRPGIRLLTGTTALAYGSDNLVTLLQRPGETGADDTVRERLWLVRARHVVLATGAVERPLVFPDNDRPGIMLAHGALTYATRFAVLAGRRAALVTSHTSGYGAAFELHRQGLSDMVIVDVRSDVPAELQAAAAARGIEVLPAHTPCGTSGGHRVRALSVAPIARPGRVRRLDCDLILMSGGWTPNVHLHSQARGTLSWSQTRQCYVPERGIQVNDSAGAARGVFELADCVADGTRAGELASATVGKSWKVRPARVLPHENCADGGMLRDNICVQTAPARAFVDFQNDVTARDIQLAIREGFHSIEHVKRYTTLGMATDQGRTSNLNGLAIAALSLGVSIPQVGLTTYRAPVVPVSFGALAGLHRGEQLDAFRHTPTHAWARAHGAVFEDVGPWKRARYFPRHGEDMEAAVLRECRATRSGVGIFDASTLGKIEVVGPDAAEFMNRMYTNSWSKLDVGRCRYGLMLREDGFVLDDGVVGRIAADRFHVTTTTTGAPRVLHHMEDYLQTEFMDLRVWLTSTTEHWAVIALNGPRARDVLARLVDDIDLQPAAFPHMAVRQGHIQGVPTRLFRVSFTGELGFEINVPADAAETIWRAVMESGESLGITPYGTEAMHVMRAEKGYIIIGQETDGTVTPGDLGLEWAIGKSKLDFVGMRSLRRPALQAAGRLQLVGLLSADGESVLVEGSQVLAAAPGSSKASIGHVTSAYRSAELDQPIALALIQDGRARMQQELLTVSPGRSVTVKVVPPVFVDPESQRLNV